MQRRNWPRGESILALVLAGLALLAGPSSRALAQEKVVVQNVPYAYQRERLD